MQLHPRQNRVELRAADVLKVDVDTAGCQPIERGADVFAAVVDAGIEAELVYHVLALVGTTGDADYPATFDFGDLSDEAADRACGRGHDHGLAGLRLGDVEQTKISGEARGN